MISMRQHDSARQRLSVWLWVLLVTLGAVVCGTGAYAAGDQEQFQAMMQAQQRLRQVERQLTKIQKEAVNAHPELQKKQDDFRSLLMTTMRSKGYTPEKDMKRLNELRKKLNDRSLNVDDRDKLIAEFQEKSSRLQKAQHDAFGEKKVKQAQQDLQAAVVAAMKKTDPNTTKLLKEMDDLKAKLDKLRSAD